jgi:hypothetical protein
MIDNMAPVEGDVLTASNTLADADGLSGPISYQWYRDGAAIAGATGTSYTTVAADVGAALTVMASYTDDQGTLENVSSNPTATIDAPIVEDEPIVPPVEEIPEDNTDPAPDTEIDGSDVADDTATALFMHHQQDEVEDREKIEYTVDEYQFSDFDYREDDSQNFGLTAPFKKMMDKVVDVAIDVSQLMDLIRIQVNEQMQEPVQEMHIRLIGGITLTLSAGMATLLTRSSAIAAGLMSSVSVMSGFDPLVAMKNGKQDRDDDELDEQVDKMFDESADNSKSTKNE